MDIKTLIDKAAEKVGNPNRLAKVLGCSSSQVYDWRDERKRCSPADRARLASLCGDDPVQELVRATLEETAGTTRGDQLRVILGKWSRQTGAALHGVVLALVSLPFGLMMLDVPRCIKREI